MPKETLRILIHARTHGLHTYVFGVHYSLLLRAYGGPLRIYLMSFREASTSDSPAACISDTVRLGEDVEVNVSDRVPVIQGAKYTRVDSESSPWTRRNCGKSGARIMTPMDETSDSSLVQRSIHKWFDYTDVED